MTTATMQTAAEPAVDEPAQAEPPTPAEPTTRIGKMWAWCKSHKVMAALIAIAL